MKGSIAVIGAGMAGMTAAQMLRASGHRVEVFERESILGGRLATRRIDRMNYDLGTPYITARTREFDRHLNGLALTGAISRWAPALYEGQRTDGRVVTPQNWFVGIPGMNSITRAMSEGLRIHLASPVRRLTRVSTGTGPRWALEFANGDLSEGFHAVLSTAPAPETYALMRDHTQEFDEITRVRMSPCWTVVVHLPTRLPVAFDAASQIGEILAWVARDTSKPSRRKESEIWILQSTPDWSKEFVEEEPDLVAEDLWREFQTAFPQVADHSPTSVSAYRWRYALVERSLASSALFSREHLLGAAGDWCLGPRAEAAFESAHALVRRVDDAFATR
ncbi:MAG: FAD-dependent oxidoreductase [Pseudomonadota bacterium]